MIGRSGFKIVAPVKDALITALIAVKIDILIIDPLIKAHRVNENDNVLMDAVVTMFADIADAANCSVELVQHTRKTNGEEVSLEDARGAGATTAAARMVRTLNRLPKTSASLAGLKEEQARYYVRIDDDAKSDLAPPQNATWFHLAKSAWVILAPIPPSTAKTACKSPSNGSGLTYSRASTSTSCARYKDRSQNVLAAPAGKQTTG